MNWLRFKPTPAFYWFGAAFTEFVNGFIDGWGAGVGAGGATGAFTGTTAVGQDMTAWNQVLISAMAIASAMVGNAIHAVYVWHKTNRFPNPWPPPTGTTTPPSPPLP